MINFLARLRARLQLWRNARHRRWMRENKVYYVQKAPNPRAVVYRKWNVPL